MELAGQRIFDRFFTFWVWVWRGSSNFKLVLLYSRNLALLVEVCIPTVQRAVLTKAHYGDSSEFSIPGILDKQVLDADEAQTSYSVTLAPTPCGSADVILQKPWTLQPQNPDTLNPLP